MADINVTGNGNYAANNFTVPVGDNDVSFHAAYACTICFSNSATFNVSSLNLPAGGSPTDLTIASRVATNFTVIASGGNCSGQLLKDTTTYTIDMSSMGGSQPYPSHKPKH